MADDEATVRSSLQIENDGLNYRSHPTSYQAAVTGTKGPSPGAVTATVDGVNVSLGELSTPGFCMIRNIDQINYVDVGIWNESIGEYQPFLEIGPEEHQIIKFSREFGRSFAETGTGSVGSDIHLRIRANTASCEVFVGAFEK